MGMKPRIEPLVNKRIDPKLCTQPNPDRGNEYFTRLEPFTISERTLKGNDAIPGVVSAPNKQGTTRSGSEPSDRRGRE